MTRVGKIARLPDDIREQINQRLLDGQQGRQILQWLNALPEVLEIMHRDFENRTISDQNLTEWKQGGFRQWFAQERMRVCVRALGGDAKELAKGADGSIADNLSTIIAARYALVIGGWHDELDPAARKEMEILGQMVKTLAQLRRGDHSAAKVKLDKARMAIKGAAAEKHVFYKFRAWLSEEKGWRFVFGDRDASDDEKWARFRKVMFPKWKSGEAMPEINEEDEFDDDDVDEEEPPPEPEDARRGI